MRRVLAIALLAFVLPHRAAAVQVNMDVQPRAVALGETVTLTLSIEGAAQRTNPDLPSLDGFTLVGRNSGTSINFDGHTQRTTVNHQFILQPARTGTLRVGPFSFELAGETFNLAAVEVQVLAANSVANPQAADLLFATLTTESTNLYHQQTFDLTLSIYSRGLNLDRNVEANFDSSGLKVEPLRELAAGREVFNNQIYDVRRWRGKATALTAGRFHFTPTVRVGLIAESRSRNRDPFFGGMFEDFFGRREVRPTPVDVKPLDLEIRPLPEAGRPPEFAGAVGRFTFDAQIQPAEVQAGEPVTVTLTLAGRGNVSLLAPPAWKLDDRFRAYDSKLVTDEVDAHQASGRRVFEQVVIPRTDAVTGLPDLVFAYFDPEQGRYETIRQGPFPLLVRASSNEASRLLQASDPAATPAERLMLGADIGYLKPAPRHWAAAWPAVGLTHPLARGAQALPPLALGLLWLLARRRDELARDVGKARRRQAPKSARAALAEAEAALGRQDAAAFHDAIWRALTGYFAHRLNLQPGEATCDVVAGRLQRGGAAPELLAAVRAAFQRCEEARFGAAGAVLDTGPARQTIDELSAVLRTCEEVRL